MNFDCGALSRSKDAFPRPLTHVGPDSNSMRHHAFGWNVTSSDEAEGCQLTTIDHILHWDVANDVPGATEVGTLTPEGPGFHETGRWADFSHVVTNSCCHPRDIHLPPASGIHWTPAVSSPQPMCVGVRNDQSRCAAEQHWPPQANQRHGPTVQSDFPGRAPNLEVPGHTGFGAVAARPRDWRGRWAGLRVRLV